MPYLNFNVSSSKQVNRCFTSFKSVLNKEVVQLKPLVFSYSLQLLNAITKTLCSTIQFDL